jgi:hypothetical protein
MTSGVCTGCSLGFVGLSVLVGHASEVRKILWAKSKRVESVIRKKLAAQRCSLWYEMAHLSKY